ncbi:class I SAM-dependent methyltransferase [Corynebacterium liangguodongii]|uniref:SAM-dependent methyltransferase n=1 Tax=Corynebacterium liangguodongii TaxID=2079535 RepID=A0A2S0WGM8_9CORY|nr:class I SAM-dependent methyltransferase [Corynebacterium liangguodongii]AWB84832.1 SAM-dependent methyltransferase [Corynebacterium liangguodongii]PWB99189.1 class I SAM-dependent methyltransferase [Corynebacterium liangguodongii]
MYRTRRLATLSRSLRLLRSFSYEQYRPGIFYGGLARDTAQLIDALWTDLTGSRLPGASVLDVGGGPGYYAAEFARLGASYVGLEPDVSELTAAGLSGYGAVRGDGAALPFADSSFDVVYSSNVAEHIPNWREMGEEMIRVCSPGGLVVLSYTVWLGPFGGHETGLWPHYVGGEFARRRYERRHGREPKNVWGSSLFAVSAADGLRWARSTGLMRFAFPRYHPRWAWWVAKVPLLREFATSNLVVVLRAPGGSGGPA